MKGHIKRGRAAATWYLRVELPRHSNGKRRQRRETVRGTKAEAQRRLRALLREVEGGGYTGTGRLTIAVTAQQWLASKEQRIAAKTYAFYASHVRLCIVPEIGSVGAESLQPAHIEAAIAAWTKRQTQRSAAWRTIVALGRARIRHAPHDPALGREDGMPRAQRRRCHRSAALRAQRDARAHPIGVARL